MFCFPLKVSVKKKVFIVRDETPIFSEALGLSLLSLYVNPTLYLRSIFSLSCDIFPIYVGFKPTVLACSFCSPPPHKQIFKEDISGFKLFPGF